MTVSASVDCVCLSLIEDIALLLIEGIDYLWLPTHPTLFPSTYPPLYMLLVILRTSVVKKLPVVLATYAGGRINYKTLAKDLAWLQCSTREPQQF